MGWGGVEISKKLVEGGNCIFEKPTGKRNMGMWAIKYKNLRWIRYFVFDLVIFSYHFNCLCIGGW